VVEEYRRDYLMRFEKSLQKEMKGFWDSLKEKKEHA
jgi:hypothetical protein